MNSRILLTMAIVAIMISLPITAFADLQNGLLAHWSFDDCTATDVTGNGHDGIMDDDPVCVDAYCGQAWLPDGINDEIEIIGNHADLMFANESMSVSLWTQVTDNPNTGRWYFYIGRDQSYYNNAEIGLGKDRSGHDGGDIQFYVGHNGALFSKARSILNGEELPKNEWLHLVGVVDYENQNVRLYLNGELQEQSAALIDFDLTSGSKPFRAHLGAYEHNEFQNGPMDEVRIYDRVLTESEIQELYEQCNSPVIQTVAFDIKPGSCPNPLNIGREDSEFWVYVDDELDDGESNENSDPLMKPSPAKRRAVLPVAILGAHDFDVSEIDIASIELEGIPVLRYSYEDVSTPLAEGVEECDCTDAGGDGFLDLTLKFNKDAVTEALGEVFVGDVIPLEITGELFEGTPISGLDCVVIVGPDGPQFTQSSGSEFGLINYPNPFNPTTQISFSIVAASHVRLDVFNITGQTVATLLDRYLQPGTHEVVWNADKVASGVFFYRLTAGGMTETKRMLLIK